MYAPHLVHAEALVDLPPVQVALALLARPLAVAAPPAQVSLLRRRHAPVVLPRVANVHEARVLAALAEPMAVRVVYAGGEDAARGGRCSSNQWCGTIQSCFWTGG